MYDIDYSFAVLCVLDQDGQTFLIFEISISLQLSILNLNSSFLLYHNINHSLSRYQLLTAVTTIGSFIFRKIQLNIFRKQFMDLLFRSFHSKPNTQISML